MDVFGKVSVNIPMLELVTKVPAYARFLKEFCTNRGKNHLIEQIHLNPGVASVCQTRLPEKCKDEGTFSIPCVIGDKTVLRALCDFGGGINMMCLKEYNMLGIGAMKDTKMVLQMADRTFKYPLGVVEDVLVKVNNFIFPVDFYIIEMNPNLPSSQTDVLLGRPFLRTSTAMIDYHNGSIELGFYGQKVKFKISDTPKCPEEGHSMNFIDTLNPPVEAIAKANKNPLEIILTKSSTYPDPQ